MDIKSISASDTYPIRQEMLRKGLPLSECVFEGDEDEQNFHLGAFINKKLVSVASFYYQNHPDIADSFQLRLRGMATLEEFQGKGFSAELLSVGFPIAKQNHCEVVWCNARVSAIGFYQKVGFESLSDTFELPGVGPHQLMFKKIIS